jgi:hypothetical protein
VKNNVLQGEENGFSFTNMNVNSTQPTQVTRQ